MTMVRSVIKDFAQRNGGSETLPSFTPAQSSPTIPAASVQELASCVPLRLNQTERHLLTVLEHTLHVSEYTDHVDVAASASGYGLNGEINRRGGVKTRRILDGILEVCHIATGLAFASGNDTGPWSCGLIKNVPAQPSDNAEFFQTLFEIGRRNKVLNPGSMRTSYGKLMYLLQDAQSPTVAKTLGFSLYKPMLMVGPFLEQNGAEALLLDKRLECAIQYVSDRDEKGKKLERSTLAALVFRKQSITSELVEAYTSDQMNSDSVRHAIESLADAVAYIESNVRPVKAMLELLQSNFDPNTRRKEFSLALTGTNRGILLPSYGRYGTSAYSSGSNERPTLNHSHSTQYMFVWQSLSLWAKVMRSIHRLWVCADDDLLSTNATYHLCNTGQGLNRVQNCPKVRCIMSCLLHQTQEEANVPWVGLSVIHLGDRDVPNALVFIDKYTQIPRFLSPIVQFINELEPICNDPVIGEYVREEFGGPALLKMTVLSDYFKHGFDGSGDDGGSCIDGRLTSSWNWTARLAKKKYYHAFLLSGFQGFDGDFR